MLRDDDGTQAPLGRMRVERRARILGALHYYLDRALRAPGAAELGEVEEQRLRGILRPDIVIRWRTPAEAKDLTFALGVVCEARGARASWVWCPWHRQAVRPD